MNWPVRDFLTPGRRRSFAAPLVSHLWLSLEPTCVRSEHESNEKGSRAVRGFGPLQIMTKLVDYELRS